MIGDIDLVGQAQFERDSRMRNYPLSVANGKLSADEATIDFQCWVQIASFLETGRFVTIDGGGVDGQTIVDWALAEAAAQRAVDTTAEALAQAEKGDDAAKVSRLTTRLGTLRMIARKVARHHAQIAKVNETFRAERVQREEGRKAA